MEKEFTWDLLVHNYSLYIHVFVLNENHEKIIFYRLIRFLRNEE